MWEAKGNCNSVHTLADATSMEVIRAQGVQKLQQCLVLATLTGVEVEP